METFQVNRGQRYRCALACGLQKLGDQLQFFVNICGVILLAFKALEFSTSKGLYLAYNLNLHNLKEMLAGR
ncbi:MULTISPECIES: hypothetical protein [Brucella]|jgi:hypothetical protein|uniref:hypothetical protein n=1 Tax=Brucella TaxID=234 RepID=UPI00044C9276|nr:hypothetical protein [Brucella anthropi]MCR5943802.1 hypothetical protein [Ochrobactrum sp. XJ1]PQZ63936.1 hypothetical protein CQ057_21615 [Ochrobactrum sp. MYb49]EXL05350.1 hypothetical protein BG46_20355 [Brucella anthropi]KIU69578.1 hypothetical protein TR92_05045 [Brucella anthropi]MBA8862621.1 hypothetical protein [Brucella anthropi]